MSRHRWEEKIRMDLKEIGINRRELVESGLELLESPCECGIEPPYSVNHGVS